MFLLLKSDEENSFELFQICLNLPKARKFVEPHFAMHWHEKIPVIETKDEQGKSTSIKIVAGKINGQVAQPSAPDSWAAEPEKEVAVWVIDMEAGATWTIPATSEFANRTLYFFMGHILKLMMRRFPLIMLLN